MKQKTQKRIIYYKGGKKHNPRGRMRTTRHPYITVHKQYITAAGRCKSHYFNRNDFHVFTWIGGFCDLVRAANPQDS